MENKKDVNNKKNNLPNEIFMKILYNIKTFDDLLNTYNIFKEHNYLIDIEIDKYLDIKNKTKRKRNWMHSIMSEFQYYIELYITETDKEDKNLNLDILRKKYNKSEISKKIIKYDLKCDICDYIYDFKNTIENHFYNCFNCNFIFCQKCCIECENCDPRDSLIYHHCLDCKNNCVIYIKKEINKTYRLILNDNNIYSKQKKTEYMDNLIATYCKNMIKLVDEDELYDVYNLLATLDFNEKNIIADNITIINNYNENTDSD